MQDDQDRLIGEHFIHQKGYQYHLVYHNESFVCESNANQTFCEIYLWCLLLRKLLCFSITKYVSSCSIACIPNFTLSGRILNFLGLFSIIKDPFAKYLFTKRDRQFNMKVEFGFSMNS